MSLIEIQTTRPWGLKLPVGVRYIETNFAEDFIRTGSLMLTTFERCITHEDGVRRDANEGKCNYLLNHGGYATAGVQKVGRMSYMLCLSMVESPLLMKRFSVDNFIRIHNILAFADAVSRWIPGFQRGQMGPCIYKNERSISKNAVNMVGIDPAAMITAADKDDPAALEKAFNESRQALADGVNRELAGDPYFLKEEIFSVEAEFRIVWTVPYEVKEPLIITCPEAVQFCSIGVQPSSTPVSPATLQSNVTGFSVTPMAPEPRE